MIVSQDSNPNRQLYYLGARLLELLQNAGEGVPFFEAYHELKVQEDISLSLFTLVADWLFLLDAVELEDGALVQCS